MMTRMNQERLTPDRRRQMTRDALIEAATEAFASRGYAGASLESIASAAGFTTGAIYSNFVDKEDLLMAVLDRHSEAMIESSTHAMDEARSETGSLTHPGDAAAAASNWIARAVATPHFEMLRLELTLHAMRNPAFAERYLEFRRLENERGAATMEEQHALYGVRTTLPAVDLSLITGTASYAIAEWAILDPENAAHYAELLTHIYLLPRAFYEPDPDADAEVAVLGT